VLLLGAVSPLIDAEFLYSPDGEFRGEAGRLLRAVQISSGGKAADALQVEFQASGLFLAHVLECPVENGLSDTADGQSDLARWGKAAAATATELLRERLPFVASRIRRSLKPKCVIPITAALEPLVQNILSLDLGCPVILKDGKSFDFRSPGNEGNESELLEFRELLRKVGSLSH